MKFLEILAVASLGRALSTKSIAGDSFLDVKLEMTGNTAVEATITNTGVTAIKLFKTGTILDDASVEKVKVYRGNSNIAFSGIRLYVSTKGLDETAFRTIAPGEKFNASFDIAEAHDVSAGGSFGIFSEGAFSFAQADSTDLTGTVPFKSNVLSTNIDGAQADAARRSYLSMVKRTAVQADCTGNNREALLKALAICQTRASAAAAAAQSNSAKITEYFKQDTTTVRNTVAGVFNKIADECANSTSGVSKYYCTDQSRNCGGGVIAYTFPAQSYIVNCPDYFSVMPEKDSRCHADDQPFVTLHEITHLRQIKGTDDYGVYGYQAVRRLSAAQNLNHADTYALFANAIEVGGSC